MVLKTAHPCDQGGFGGGAHSPNGVGGMFELDEDASEEEDDDDDDNF